MPYLVPCPIYSNRLSPSNGLFERLGDFDPTSHAESVNSPSRIRLNAFSGICSNSRLIAAGWRGRAKQAPNSLMSLYATFPLTFLDSFQRSRIDVGVFLGPSSPEGRIHQVIKFAVVRPSGSLANCPAQLGDNCVSGIEVAHAVVPGKKVFNHCGCFQ